MTDAPKIHVDDDWKAQAEADREKLRAADARSEERAGRRARDPEALPPADFRSLVGVLASQALMGLGAYSDPQSGRVMVDLAGAHFAIDLLALLETKTKGNITAEEAQELNQTVTELRSRFVQIANLAARQQASGEIPASVGGASPTGGSGPAKPSIIIPG